MSAMTNLMSQDATGAALAILFLMLIVWVRRPARRQAQQPE